MSSRELRFSTTRTPPGRRAARSVGIVIAIIAVLLLLWGGVVSVLWGYAWLRLGPDEVPALDADDEALGIGGAAGPAGATTVLVSLTGPVDPTVPRPPDLAGPVMLVQYGGERDEPAVLALPGELPVSVAGTGEQPLNDVQSQGGTDLLVRSLTDYTGVRIDHAVSLSIDALPDLVDATAPLEVCGVAGCVVRTGDEVRSAVAAATDEELIPLVAEVTQALGERIDGWFAVTSPLASRKVVETIDSEVLTDVGLRGTALLEVADALAATGPLDIGAVPLVVNPATGQIVALSEPAAVRFQHLRDGSPLRAAGDEGGTQELAEAMVSAVDVAVLNGAGVDGLAGQVQAQLEATGFRVVGTGNAASFGRSETVINYVADDDEVAFAAAELAEILGDVSLEPLQQTPEFEGEDVDLLVTVGEDLDGS